MVEMEYIFIYYLSMAAAMLIAIPYVFRSRQGLQSPAYSAVCVALVSLFAIFYFGLRPGDVGTDTPAYLTMFREAKIAILNNWPLRLGMDPGFEVTLRLCARLFSEGGFLMVCSALFVVPMSVAFRRIFGRNDMLLPLLIMMCSFFFLDYGINILRQGIGYAFFILAMTQRRIGWKIAVAAVAVSFHISLLIPAGIYFLLCLVKVKTRYPVIIWVVTLVVVAMGIDVFPRLFELMSGSTIAGRAEVYLNSNWIVYRTGFRIDFVLFSLFFMLAGLWLNRKVWSDNFSRIVLNLYVLTNAVFMLTMNYPYSDRYARLSWTLIPVMLAYPLVKCGRRTSLWLYCCAAAMLAISLLLEFRL